MKAANRMESIPFSGIRKVFEEVSRRTSAGEDIIHLEIGRPDFDTPVHIKEAAKLIAQSRNPLIVVGAGANDAGEEILALAEMLQAPVTAHRSGKGVVSDKQPLALRSVAAWQYWPTCDLVIGLEQLDQNLVEPCHDVVVDAS